MLRRRPPRPAPGPPAVAGRFVLLEELGRGGCGRVHRAHDLRTRTYVAAKVARGAEARARLAREGRLAVRHPHVVAATAYAEDASAAVLALELVRGGTLADLVARHGRLPEPTVALLLGQLLDALGAVHAAGLVHGDVKPANLLLRPGPRPHLLLADFGVAGAAGPRELEGTPAYLPPERLAGAPAHPSQDVYAAGVVARRVLGGGSPLLTLCDSMTRAEPDRRPSAEAAGRRLRELTGPR